MSKVANIIKELDEQNAILKTIAMDTYRLDSSDQEQLLNLIENIIMANYSKNHTLAKVICTIIKKDLKNETVNS